VRDSPASSPLVVAFSAGGDGARRSPDLPAQQRSCRRTSYFPFLERLDATALRRFYYLTLKRASASRPSGEWGEDDYDVLADSVVVGRIVKAAASPVGKPWMWTMLLYHEGRTPTHGYEPTREAAMAAFAKSWRRE
jgi:hypothetical protein